MKRDSKNSLRLSVNGPMSKLLFMLTAFLVGFVSLIGVRLFFLDLSQKIDRQTDLAQNQLMVGEHVIRDLTQVEANIHKMVILRNTSSMQLLLNQTEQRIEHITDILDKLDHGGEVTDVVRLNLEEREVMERKFTLSPLIEESDYALASIELYPKLARLRDHIKAFVKLIDVKNEALKQSRDLESLRGSILPISRFMKKFDAQFRRMKEDAGRIYHRSVQQVEKFRSRQEKQKQRYVVIEAMLILGILVTVLLAGYVLARQIMRDQLSLEYAKEQALSSREEAILSREEALEAKEVALSANKAKDEFLASMSHELRTPLTTIIGNSEALKGGELGEREQGMLRAIESSGRRQLALVNDILDLSKIESGKFEINSRPYDLAVLVADIRELFVSQAESKQINFDVVVEAAFKHLLVGDEQRIGQVLINLLGNAFKFTEQGTIALRVWRESDRLWWSVRDEGIGMSEAVLKRLFRPFEQADSSISRRFGGTGLGLHISRVLVDLMGGEISVESEEGKGSIFRFGIPLVEDQALVSSATTEETQENRYFKGRVLVAEDTVDIQDLQRIILEGAGVEVTFANNGAEAVEAATHGEFDLLLMDMHMPVMDGIAATKKLRELGSKMPIIAVTANVMQKHRDQFQQAGCDGFISKPFVHNDIYKILGRYLESVDELEGGGHQEDDCGIGDLLNLLET